MEKSRIMEDFQMEFELLYCGNKNMSLNYVLNELFENLEEVDVARGVIDLERKRNRRRKFLSGVLGKHAAKFGYLDGWYYDAEFTKPVNNTDTLPYTLERAKSSSLLLSPTSVKLFITSFLSSSRFKNSSLKLISYSLFHQPILKSLCNSS